MQWVSTFGSGASSLGRPRRLVASWQTVRSLHEHVIQGRWTSFLKKLIPQSAGMP